MSSLHYTYSDTFKHTIISTYGDHGATWLKQLPDIIEQCKRQWQLSHLTPYTHLTYNYVLSGKMNNMPIVLKLSCGHQAMEQEIAALTAFKAYGCVDIIAYNIELGALLLPCIIPGDPLSALFPHDDVMATGIAAHLMASLHKAPIAQGALFPTLDKLLPTFDKDFEELAPFIASAKVLKRKLLQASSEPVLLHGDFHQDNVLLSDSQNWIAIDPAGIIGDPCYDLAIYIRNPLTTLIALPNAQEIILNRIERFAAHTGYDRQCIADWTYLQAATSAYWSKEDGLDATNHIIFLRTLSLCSGTMF